MTKPLGASDAATTPLLRLDTLEAFDPLRFEGFRMGWRLRPENSDPRSALLNELDPNKLRTVSPLTSREGWIRGDEQVRRIRAGVDIPLDLRWLRFFWTHKDRIPKMWRERIGGYVQCIYFDGDELLDPDGDLFALGMCWRAEKWHLDVRSHKHARMAQYPSVVLVQHDFLVRPR